MVHYYPFVQSKIKQQVLKKERKIKAVVSKVLPLYTSHMPKPAIPGLLTIPSLQGFNILCAWTVSLDCPVLATATQHRWFMKLHWLRKPLLVHNNTDTSVSGQTETRLLPTVSAAAGPGELLLLINHCIKGETFIKETLLSLLYLIAMILQ